jgi:hypothetical protein
MVVCFAVSKRIWLGIAHFGLASPEAERGPIPGIDSRRMNKFHGDILQEAPQPLLKAPSFADCYQ